MSVCTLRMTRSNSLSVLLAMALSGCAGIKVQSEYDAAAEPALVESYAWNTESTPTGPGMESKTTPPTADAIEDEALVERIHREVDANLAARGLRKVPAEDADVLVSQQTSIEVKADEKDSYYAYYSVELYEEGTLAIDFTDPATSRIVWQGTGSARLRTVGAGMGVSLAPPELFPHPKPRCWPAEEMVDAILAKLTASH